MALPGFLYNNLAAGLTPAAGSSSAEAAFPWTNLDNPQPRKRVRVAATSLILIYDLVSPANPVDTWFLGSTSLPTGASARVRSSDSDATVTGSLELDTGVVPAVTSPEYNGQVVLCFASTSSRYWRLDIAGANNPIDIGISMLGLLFRPEHGLSYDFQEGRIDHSIRDLNEDTGGEFAISGPKKRSLQFVFGATESEVRGLTTSFSEMDRMVGASGDVLFVEDSDETALTRARDSLYGPYREVGASFAARATNELWTRVFQMRERI